MKINFYVIGGQYHYHCYGGTGTLAEAKRLAVKNAEHWNNLMGIHIPAVYRAEDTTEVATFANGSYSGWEMIRMPKFNAHPVM